MELREKVVDAIFNIISPEAETLQQILSIPSKLEISTKLFHNIHNIYKNAGYCQVDMIKKVIFQSIADEPEYPNDMPDEMWQMIEENYSRESITQIMRSTVRLTKNGITDRFKRNLAQLAQCRKAVKE